MINNMIIVFINCDLFPFVSWILAGKKIYETRNRNTLKRLIGKTIYIAETRNGKKPVVKCIATIASSTTIVTKKEYNRLRKQAMIKKDSVYDFIPGKKKVFYKLENVKPVQEFTPENGIHHGRSWMECNTGDFRQWIADVYHCSDCWGEKMTTEEMELLLTEHMKEKDPEEYSPAPFLAGLCAEYWNELCELYPV